MAIKSELKTLPVETKADFPRLENFMENDEVKFTVFKYSPKAGMVVWAHSYHPVGHHSVTWNEARKDRNDGFVVAPRGTVVTLTQE